MRIPQELAQDASMAKKKNSTSPGKARSKPKLQRRTPLPDPRVIEAVMRKVGGLLVDAETSGPAAEAQDMMYEAVEVPPPQQVKLARKALKIWPDCADAYVVLAEQAETLPQAIELFEQAVAAGQRALGTDFEDMAGQFWGFIETRPYMRARLGLAHCLHAAGRREEAAKHYREMLRLNPNDNQGVRETLAACLLELGQNDELGGLLERYREDGSAAWAYASVLLAYRTEGESERARQLLAAARKTNKYVPAYLLGNKLLPQQLPEYVGLGDEAEAIAYAANFLPAWKSTPGVISWLRARVAAVKSRQKPATPRLLPLLPTITDDELRSVPIEADEMWQADIRRLPSWVRESGRLVRPWMILVIDADNDLIMAHELSMDRPPPETLWQTVAAAIAKPTVGQGMIGGLLWIDVVRSP
jgi:tetratricopeptide (TPR) repeat protein